MRYIRLYFQMMSANLRGLMAFKADFLVSFFGGLLSHTIGLVFMGVLFMNVPEVAGWNVYQVALLYGYIFVAEGVFTLGFQGTIGFWYQMRYGIVDRYLLRPIPVTLQFYGKNINLAGMGTGIVGLYVIAYAWRNLALPVSLGRILLLIVSLVFGAVIRINLNFAASILSGLVEGATDLGDTVENMREMGKYPLDIYPKAFRVILLSLIPYAAISYVPASVLLGKMDPMFFWAMPGAMVLIILLRILFYRKAMEKYEGAGN